MPSRTSAALAFLLLAGSAALAQDTAKSRMQAEGDASLARVKRAVTKTQDQAERARDPRIPVDGNEASKRQAFEGLRHRAPRPDMEARARAAAKAGEASLAAEREAQAKRLRQAFGLEPLETEALARGAAPTRAMGFVPLLFVSSSMPIATLLEEYGRLGGRDEVRDAQALLAAR
ncbi:hypothetical protein [Sphingomonas abietis]|uniref:Uncharacterized protein n=1 Tax=Sphingomonas abietis TaxID=3012344 RepID=A0ABY7NQJ1_9SPHN|nr:hypothetical protein [Sphingomonas abietis]WBO21756.1 hypothetical protein PBT88_16525 [Sphingomonas abietis]